MRCFDLDHAKIHVSLGYAGDRIGEDQPEVSSQINDLPRTKPDQHAHGAESEPLDTLVRALVRIPQLLLSRPKVLHLVDDLRDRLFHATEVGFNGLQLLLGLNARPVAGIGTDVNVEFDSAGRIRHRVCTNRENMVSSVIPSFLFSFMGGLNCRADNVLRPFNIFSKHTSNDVSAGDVNA